MNKIKVCFIIGTLEVGGTEKQLYLLLKNMDKSKFSPFVISLRDGRMRNDFQQISTLYILNKKYKFDVTSFLTLVKVILKEKPDIVHTFLFTSNTWGRLAAILTGVPVIIASERSMDIWKKKFHFFIDTVLGFFTDAIICNSIVVKEFYEKKLGPVSRKLTVIRNGIEWQQFNIENQAHPKNEKIIFTASRLAPEKGIEYLIQAIKILSARMNNMKLLVAGEGPLKTRLEYLVEQQGIKEIVTFLGYQENVSKYISQADVVVLPSLWEGLPNILLEAMAMKKPVVATAVGGTKEIVRDGENGFLVRPKDAKALAEAIQKILQDINLAINFGESGYRFVRENFDLFLMVSSYEKLYQKLLLRNTG